MNDPRDFLAWTGFGTVGSLLLALGLLGCVLHSQPLRRLAAAAIALTGSLLLLDGAQLLHGLRPAPAVSVAVAVSGLAVLLLFWPVGTIDPATLDADPGSQSTAENLSQSEEDSQQATA